MSGDFSLRRKMKKMLSPNWLGPRLNDAVGQGNDARLILTLRIDSEIHSHIAFAPILPNPTCEYPLRSVKK